MFLVIMSFVFFFLVIHFINMTNVMNSAVYCCYFCFQRSITIERDLISKKKAFCIYPVSHYCQCSDFMIQICILTFSLFLVPYFHILRTFFSIDYNAGLSMANFFSSSWSETDFILSFLLNVNFSRIQNTDWWGFLSALLRFCFTVFCLSLFPVRNLSSSISLFHCM